MEQPIDGSNLWIGDRLTIVRGPEIAVDREPDTDRIFTIPNIISLVRLAGIPVCAWLILSGHNAWGAVALALVSGTDWVDGGLARRWHQVTTLGKVLDPTIDRLLILVAFVTVLIDGAMPLWIGVVLLAREVLVGLGGIALGIAGAPRISVTWEGKVYASGVMATLPLFLLGASTWFLADVMEVLAWLVVVPSAILGWMTAWKYASVARHNMVEKRKESTAAGGSDTGRVQP